MSFVFRLLLLCTFSFASMFRQKVGCKKKYSIIRYCLYQFCVLLSASLTSPNLKSVGSPELLKNINYRLKLPWNLVAIFTVIRYKCCFLFFADIMRNIHARMYIIAYFCKNFHFYIRIYCRHFSIFCRKRELRFLMC